MLALILLSISLAGSHQGPARVVDRLDPLEITPQIEEYLATQIDHSGTELQRLEQLVEIVFKKNDLGFSYEPITKTAAETFEERSGNCLSFTNMFIAMARHVGLTVRFREVDVVPTWKKAGEIFVVGRHVNVSVQIGPRNYTVDLLPQVDRVELAGRVVSDRRGLAHYYNNLGVRVLSEGNVELAMDWFALALEADDQAVFVWANLGVAQAHAGLYPEAESSYFRSLELDKHNVVAMSNLVELYERMGQEEKADSYLKKTRRFRMKNPYYHYNLGEMAYQHGTMEKALRHYKAAIKRKRTDHRFHFALAKTYARLGQFDDVVQHLKKAREYAPDENGRIRYHEKLEILASNAQKQDIRNY
jgi:tetratricopeptide (TPR) repeat protein